MPGKRIKDEINDSIVALQNKCPLSRGFPLFCFVISDNEDVAAFFSKELFHERDVVKVLSSKTDWEQIGVEIGMFDSRGDSRRNNFSGVIKQGWHQVTVGKGTNQKFVFLFKE